MSLLSPRLDPRYYEHHRLAKWNVQPTILSSMDARLTRRSFPELSKADHERLAVEYAKAAGKARQRYKKTLHAAIKKYGDTTHPVSGIYNADFPEKVKTKLRELVHVPQDLESASVAHWGAAGKRTPWRSSPLYSMAAR